jgi:molybdenum cofactor cytidylyltransferase
MARRLRRYDDRRTMLVREILQMDRDPARFAAVVLAAGMSRRMGQPKSLLDVGGKPLLVRVIDAAVAAGGIDPIIDPIVVITGHVADQVAKILHGLPVHLIHNPAYASAGMLSSVQTGVAAVAGKADAFFIVLGDQPMVRPQTLRALADEWIVKRPRVLLPSHCGKHGHPILLSADGAAEILALGERDTLKTYTSKQLGQTLELEIDDSAILWDIDTPADYQAAVARWKEGSNA